MMLYGGNTGRVRRKFKLLSLLFVAVQLCRKPFYCTRTIW